MTPSLRPVVPSVRALGPPSWQRRMTARVAVACGAAISLELLLVRTSTRDLPFWAQVALIALVPAAYLIAVAEHQAYAWRATLLTAVCVAAPLLAATRGSEDQQPWLLAVLFSVGCSFFIGPLGSFVVSAFFALALPLVHWGIASELPDAAWQNAALSLVYSNIAVWWINHSLTHLRKTLTQRDELAAFMREETEERIAQLETQQALERQLRQSQKMEALGTLAGGVAHDFNNLLLVIASGAQSAQDADPEELEEILQELKEAAKRGNGLTQQLLAYGRRRVGERTLLPLNDEISQSLQLLRRLIPSNVTLEFTADSQVSAVEATAVDIDQVIMNLCINARDAMPNGGRVEISTSLVREPGHLGSDAMIRVRDHGVGMSDEQKERAFEPFFTTKRQGSGTGLGLSVVHTVVQNNKGRMELESSLGKGTEFRVYFPHVEHKINATSLEGSLASGVGGEHILLVDDDPAVRKGIARVLKRAGYDVVLAADGVDAWHEYQNTKRPFDLVVTDVMMPRMGGRELCEAVARRNPRQPCLVCSGYDAGTLDESFFREHEREFLAKPFDNDELLRRMDQMLRMRKMSLYPTSSSRTQSFRGTGP